MFCHSIGDGIPEPFRYRSCLFSLQRLALAGFVMRAFAPVVDRAFQFQKPIHSPLALAPGVHFGFETPPKFVELSIRLVSMNRLMCHVTVQRLHHVLGAVSIRRAFYVRLVNIGAFSWSRILHP